MSLALGQLLDELQAHALKGSWRSVLNISQKQQHRPRSTIGLILGAFEVLALMKLKRYSPAADALSRQDPLGPLGHMPHPSQDPLTSWASFTLNYLGAQLLFHLNSPQLCMEKLHDLMAACRQLADSACNSSAAAPVHDVAATSSTSQKQSQHQGARPIRSSQSYDEILQLFSQKSGSLEPLLAAAAVEAGLCEGTPSSLAAAANATPQLQPTHASSINSDTPSPPGAADAAVWLKRWRFVTCSLVNAHVQQQQPAIAFQLLNQLLIAQPEDPWLWSTVGRLQLQLGHVHQAELSFLKAEQGFAASPPDQPVLLEDVQRVISHNKICLKIMALDLQGGLTECETALARDPSDALATSNKALCLVHLGHLSEALQLTEAGLNRDAYAFLQEGILTNLGLMYDLAYPCGDSSKQARHLVAAAALSLVPDDFSVACIEPKA